MKALLCKCCGNLFQFKQALRKLITVAEPTVDWDSTPRHFTLECCPKCGSDDLANSYLCLDCHQREPSPGDDLCLDCRVLGDTQEMDEYIDYRDGVAA